MLASRATVEATLGFSSPRLRACAGLGLALLLGARDARAGAPEGGAAPSASSAPPAPASASAPARPPPLEEDAPPATGRARHVDLGTAAVLIAPLADSVEEGPSKVHYAPGPGFSAYARILLCDYLETAAVFSWAVHDIESDAGALGQAGLLDDGPLASYRLEAHVMPTLAIGDRVRLFLIAGLGWGRLETGPMHVREADGSSFVVRGRGASYFDVPLGLGASFELVPNWLGLDVMSWASPTFAQHGTAHTSVQSLDAEGHPETVGPLPEVPVWFVESIGLSVLL